MHGTLMLEGSTHRYMQTHTRVDLVLVCVCVHACVCVCVHLYVCVYTVHAYFGILWSNVLYYSSVAIKREQHARTAGVG